LLTSLTRWTSPAGRSKRYSIFSVAVICILSGLADCNPTTPALPYIASAKDEVVYVISGGWHTAVGLPVAEISGPLAALKPAFPTARYLVFGWGAHDYYMARNPGIGDLLRGGLSRCPRFINN
jgi:hypothetical protein